LAELVKEPKRVVELMQKPFSMYALIDIVENKEAYQRLKQLLTRIKEIEQNVGPITTDQIRDLSEDLRKIQSIDTEREKKKRGSVLTATGSYLMIMSQDSQRLLSNVDNTARSNLLIMLL
jgi:hypothetical protein